VKKLAAEISWKNAAKYLTHGLAFSTLFSVLTMAGLFISAILVEVGAVIGFAIGLVLLFLSLGFLNTPTTEYLQFKVKYGFWDLLFHGAALFALLLVVNSIIGGVSTWVFPGIALTVIALVIAAFVEGGCGPGGG
jgi:hypothetical protein